ncbi:YfcC family protein [Streptomyces mobaraensis NBRC 13819 = DSM 40847]|uniref:C4-dicarboxylate anaerobic carrier n=1 Tax=Streptomyces mobaraensis (strain ATCC 29032 / DSM 40847 / JCM 4168 / NBRC 13819 / NCIMB 11159 / IPCR 16-22) TaxID=1223523 RepID=M3BM12_STRM1|nr:Na+/H+ antiporter NhaC family protein [Streptomyces mobaraensis]EMF00660.1 C4-dicarboxylate anaerobic carrier [Streptomyces mobaraensis NBRC 13819 = DSM 40847]QTT72119.1 YfcC family protein [Streptomyces mobaraensis NBRC 13819 = DSM 40847]
MSPRASAPTPAPADEAGGGAPAAPGTPAPPAVPKKKGFHFPSAFTVLAAVTLAVWALTFVIPSGRYETKDGGPVPGTYHSVHLTQDFGARLKDLFLSPVNGLYGVTDDTSGLTAPGGTGAFFGAAGVFLFVLAVGAFITVTLRTGALTSGVARLADRLQRHRTLLLIVLMSLFSLGGTTYGMAEETLGFYGLMIPLMLKLGYDRMVGATVIMVGAGVGTLASTVNPFATGVASDSAGIGTGDGIVLRLLMWAVLTALAAGYVVRYADRVHAAPGRSLVAPLPEDEALRKEGADAGKLTARQKAVLALFAATFLFMIFAVIPWADLHVTFLPTLGWYFPELAALFIAAAVLVGLVAGLGEKGITNAITAGAGDFIGAAMIIMLARGVTVIMNNASVTDTILDRLQHAVSGTSSGFFAVLMFLVNLPLAFFVPSSSGHAALAMPILAPLADFAGVSRAAVVTAYQSASGWVNLITPTSAVVMGGLALAKVRYDRYLRFIAPLMGILLVAVAGFMVLGAALG